MDKNKFDFALGVVSASSCAICLTECSLNHAECSLNYCMSILFYFCKLK